MIKSFAGRAKVAVLCVLLGGVTAVKAEPTAITYLLPSSPTLPAFAPWVIAQHKGYYTQENLKVTFIAGKGGVDVAKQIGAGNALIGGAIGDTSIIVRANGVPVKTVAVLGSGGLTVVAVDNKSGIDSVKALKGKTMTVMSYSDTTYYALLASLRMAGLSKSDVDIQAAGPSGVWQLFTAGKSQAMAGVADWVVNAEEAGASLSLLPQSEVFASMAQAIIASDEAITKHPQVVSGVVKASLQGMYDIIASPAQAAATFAEAVPAYKGREALLEKTFRLYIERVYGKHPSGRVDPERLDQVRKFYVSEGIVARETPLEALYTNQFVPAELAASQEGLHED